MSAAARTLPTPKSRSMSRRVEEWPVELLKLADGVGNGKEPPGLRGHGAGPQRQVETGPPRGGVHGFTPGAATGALCSGSTAAGATEASSTTTTPARPGRSKVAASSATVGQLTSGFARCPDPGRGAANLTVGRSGHGLGVSGVVVEVDRADASRPQGESCCRSSDWEPIFKTRA